MTDADDLEIDFDPNDTTYAEPERRYQEVLDSVEVNRLVYYDKYEAMIEEGKGKISSGRKDIMYALHKIHAHELWKAAYSEASGGTRKYASQNQWLDECLARHKLERMFGETSFFNAMRAIGVGTQLELEHGDSIALGLNHAVVDEMVELGGIEIKTVRQGKRYVHVPVVTEAGRQKLLGDGSKSLGQYMAGVARLPKGQAMKMVREDMGKRNTYCSMLAHSNGQHTIEHPKYFGLEIIDATPSGNTPYQALFIFESEMPDDALARFLAKVKPGFRP